VGLKACSFAGAERVRAVVGLDWRVAGHIAGDVQDINLGEARFLKSPEKEPALRPALNGKTRVRESEDPLLGGGLGIKKSPFIEFVHMFGGVQEGGAS